MSTSIKIFYSWQSDSDEDCNNRAIRKGILESIPKLEEAFPKIKVQLEEATSNLPGSPNIPTAIFEKINAADIFVADITTINPEAKERKTPNPNVLIELGFAVATLGWSRIIMLYNETIGNFPNDVPFDFDRHRISTFKVKDKSDTNGKGSLRGLLTAALQEVIEKNPARPDMAIEKQNLLKKRDRDIALMKPLLSTLHLPLFEKFLGEAPRLIDTRILHHYDAFHAIFNQTSFHLYDKKMHELLQKLDEHWTKSLSYDHSYRDSSSEHMQVFGISTSEWKKETDPKKKAEQEQDYYKIKENEAKEFEILSTIIRELRNAFAELINYIKESYIEINLDETSGSAREQFKNDYSPQ